MTPDATAAPLAPELVERVERLLAGARRDGRRRVLGLVGAPGAGKSTLAAQVARRWPDDAVVVPMDGFHLAQTELERLGRAQRKGAPDTFDAAGYVALLRRLRGSCAAAGTDGQGAADDVAGTVYAPEYRRDLRNGVAGAIAVGPHVPLVVTEGNYLLLETHGFGPVAALLDESWFVAPDDRVRLERLVARHVAFGKDPAAAHDWAHGPDERNARLVAATAVRADLVLSIG